MRERNPILEYVILAVAVVAAIVIFVQVKNQDINLCRYVFKGLTKANYAVEKFIDWGNLNAMGVDVGATYSQMAEDVIKERYKAEFIKNFAHGFNKVGGKLNTFTNWRIYQRENQKVVVAADNSQYNKTILFTLSKSGRTKLISIQWKEDEKE